MSNFIKQSGGSKLGAIHTLLEAATGVPIGRSGQINDRSPRPFMVYDQTLPEKKYKRHQIMKQYVVPDLPGTPTAQYKNPHKFSIQYTIVFNSQDANCPVVIQNLSRYLVTDKFKLAMDKLDVKFYMSSDIVENIIPIEGFTDRQFIFVIDYFWADIWTDSDNDATVGAITTANIAETTAPGGS